jgi:hypothetical protein
MANLIKAIGNLPNTFWGIIILLLSMRIAVHYNAEIGYYFAGVGSTLCGIAHVQSNQIQDKVKTDASD